jgi:hypothetical protein
MITLEPGEKGRIYLEKHEGIENAPYCLVKSLSIRQQREYIKKYEDMFETVSGIDLHSKMVNLFKEYVEDIVGYSSKDPEDAFSQGMLMEVLRKLIGGVLTPHEKKS